MRVQDLLFPPPAERPYGRNGYIFSCYNSGGTKQASRTCLQEDIDKAAKREKYDYSYIAHDSDDFREHRSLRKYMIDKNLDLIECIRDRDISDVILFFSGHTSTFFAGESPTDSGDNDNVSLYKEMVLEISKLPTVRRITVFIITCYCGNVYGMDDNSCIKQEHEVFTSAEWVSSESESSDDWFFLKWVSEVFGSDSDSEDSSTEMQVTVNYREEQPPGEQLGITTSDDSNGWEITEIKAEPGQPNLQVGDIIIGFDEVTFVGKEPDEQFDLFKKQFKDGGKLTIKRKD